MIAVQVREPSQMAEARREAVRLAQRLGFDETDAGRVAIVVTELATNLVKHGQGGVILLGAFDDETGSGVECLALDKGEGMSDVGLSSRDGESTAGSSGNGLGAVLRGSHMAQIYSRPGQGTAILARLQQGAPTRSAAPSRSAMSDRLPGYGVVCVPMTGEEANGDAWCKVDTGSGFSLMVADGLGHGTSAAIASHAAVQAFNAHPGETPEHLLNFMHRALQPTRGAAISIAQVDPSSATLVFAGVGNVAGTLVGADGHVRRMVSHNGTAGHVVKRIQEFRYPLADASLIVLCSDGLGTGWKLDDYPGLGVQHPSLIAGVLYRDFNRDRDDVTVLVARTASQ